jgi:hypothetical protein
MPYIHRRSEEVHKRVEHVGSRIVQGARIFCEAKVKSRRLKLAEDGGKMDGDTSERIMGELVHWEHKLRMCKGNWTYVVIDSPFPNAFVSDLAPRKIFVHSSLISRLKCDDDELGMVLGHEISHLLHGHTERRHQKLMYWNMFQLVFLTMLDSSGVLTLLALPFADRMQKVRVCEGV